MRPFLHIISINRTGNNFSLRFHMVLRCLFSHVLSFCVVESSLLPVSFLSPLSFYPSLSPNTSSSPSLCIFPPSTFSLVPSLVSPFHGSTFMWTMKADQLSLIDGNFILEQFVRYLVSLWLLPLLSLPLPSPFPASLSFSSFPVIAPLLPCYHPSHLPSYNFLLLLPVLFFPLLVIILRLTLVIILSPIPVILPSSCYHSHSCMPLRLLPLGSFSTCSLFRNTNSLVVDYLSISQTVHWVLLFLIYIWLCSEQLNICITAFQVGICFPPYCFILPFILLNSLMMQ